MHTRPPPVSGSEESPCAASIFPEKLYVHRLDGNAARFPHDDQTQVRIQLEAQAVLAIITLFEQGNVELISSETLHFEVERTPKSRRRKYLLNLLAEIPTYVETTDAIGHKAKEYAAAGIKAIDALHLATALEAEADYFCSCDDKFVKKAKDQETGLMRVVTPLELIEELER